MSYFKSPIDNNAAATPNATETTSVSSAKAGTNLNRNFETEYPSTKTKKPRKYVCI